MVHLVLGLAPVLLGASWLTLSSCSDYRALDDAALRKEFAVPGHAWLSRYEAHPTNGGQFGREGLKVRMTYQFEQAAFAQYAVTLTGVGQWRPLPISNAFLGRMAAIQTRKEQRLKSWHLTGQTPPPAGTVYHLADTQMLSTFEASLEPLPKQGLYQVRTAGDNIMRAPKLIVDTPDRDLNDFMLAVLDHQKKQLLIRVSTFY
jgi:hypothetical protein